MITKKKRIVFIILAVIAVAAIGLSIWGITVVYKKNTWWKNLSDVTIEFNFPSSEEGVITVNLGNDEELKNIEFTVIGEKIPCTPTVIIRVGNMKLTEVHNLGIIGSSSLEPGYATNDCKRGYVRYIGFNWKRYKEDAEWKVQREFPQFTGWNRGYYEMRIGLYKDKDKEVFSSESPIPKPFKEISVFINSII